jgi:hypothetical protein
MAFINNLKKYLQNWIPHQDKEFFPAEIWNLVKGYDKCTNVKGHYTTEQRQFHDFSINHFLTIVSVTLLTDPTLQQGMVGWLIND